MKSIFNLAIILPLAVFSVALTGCSEPAAPTDTAKPEMGADADADKEPAASGDKMDEGKEMEKESGSGSH